MSNESDIPPADAASERRLSYKFQRLREQIRAAIDAGDLAGKLPGERSLARQFNVNAKTLSKALTDLAAEGVLERNIGLGTFVRGASDTATPSRLLLLNQYSAGRDGHAADAALVDALRTRGLNVEDHDDASTLPPSLLNPYDAILVGGHVPNERAHELVVRGKTLVALDRLLTPLATHAVLAHAERVAYAAAKRLADLGHRHLMLVGNADGDLRAALAAAFPATLWTDAADADDLPLGNGATAALCVGVAAARAALECCRRHGVSVPGGLSVSAFGRARTTPPCDGQFVTDTQVGDLLAEIFRAGLSHRPVTLWLTGECVTVGTTACYGAEASAV